MLHTLTILNTNLVILSGNAIFEKMRLSKVRFLRINTYLCLSIWNNAWLKCTTLTSKRAILRCLLIIYICISLKNWFSIFFWKPYSIVENLC